LQAAPGCLRQWALGKLSGRRTYRRDGL